MPLPESDANLRRSKLIPSSPGEGVHSALARNLVLSTDVLFLLEVCRILETISVIWGKGGSVLSKAEYIRILHFAC